MSKQDATDKVIYTCEKCSAELNGDDKFCPNCGAKIIEQVDSYQEATNYIPNDPANPSKSKLVAGLLGIFLGSLGIHNFYLGYNNRGLTQLLISVIGGACTCGVASSIVGIWGLVEGILILTGSANYTKDASGRPLVD